MSNTDGINSLSTHRSTPFGLPFDLLLKERRFFEINIHCLPVETRRNMSQ